MIDKRERKESMNHRNGGRRARVPLETEGSKSDEDRRTQRAQNETLPEMRRNSGVGVDLDEGGGSDDSGDGDEERRQRERGEGSVGVSGL